ncbi:hypothetical protein RHGRI_005763 [Rhododendron griersonianum]|uniref:Peptidase A1 domain-containing protein n=1 Tax=Rhododendron griersonianum TaxID=479676 RepID=A0AAV6LEP4_9ERIC|nr:hypothetical protein RHGRI_005763 [Rhododendron griersonianum]
MGPMWWDRIRLWWLASKSHGFNGDAQLERSGDRATPNVPDLTRTVYSPSPSSGTAGGLALWWTDEVILDVRFKTKNLMKCVVSWPRIKNSWLVTFVYAPPVWNHRVAFWNVLKDIAKENGYPWLCVGDLNEIGSSAEKQGGGEGNIRIRLDRALADVEWRNLFPLAQVLHEVRIGSDHCPLVIKCRVPLKRIPYTFKFESMWSSHPDCEQVVAKEWECQHRGSDMYGLVQRLKCCKEALLRWSKRTFGKDKLRLKVLQEKLKGIQAEPYSQVRFEQEKEYVKEVEILLLREEMMLHQRSRINWLSYGDRNSAFFHASINQRRQRNQLVNLRTSRGEWIESEEGINGLIKDFFLGLFSHSGQRDFSEALSVGAPVYGYEMILVCESSEEREADKTHYIVVNVKSMDPSPYCVESTKDQSKRESLKIVNKNGPCSSMNEEQTSAPTLPEIMSHDQARVESLQQRLRVNLDGISLADSTATPQANPGQSPPAITFCYQQQEPIFNPSASQTYKNLSCTTPQCSQLLISGCTRTTNTCLYAVLYGDGSFTIGLYATETLTLIPSDVFPDFAFGCGLNNTGLFRGAAGLLGLGRGPPSLVAQTASKYGSYFSYCLPTLSSSSGTLVFGKYGGTTNSAGIKYTPLLTNSNGPSFYFVEVTGIKVAGELLPISQSVFSSSGTIIDSGTVITRLQVEAYDALRTTFRRLMMKYTRTQDLSLFDTCYDFSDHDTVEVPMISFLFSSDVEVPIPFPGILIGSIKQACLAFAGNSDASDVGYSGIRSSRLWMWFMILLVGR